ncbi:MAG TPA: hypothetical protein VFH31_00080 [Pyrinomonadaceae bacterium]|nr:hypothetical protein [Pyrinomonadaceae bacterium]
MKLVSTTLFLILIVASPAFSLSGRNDKTVADETNYKEVNGFSGYLTLDDYPHEKVQRWLDPVGIATLSAMPTMKRGKTMGAFVELRGCQQNARGMCNTRVNYTIYKPDGSIFATRAVRQGELLWKKQAPLAPHTSYPKTRNRLKKQGRKMGSGIAFNQSEGLARMHFKLGKDDPVGEYKVKAKVTDSNANISFEIELNFYLR